MKKVKLFDLIPGIMEIKWGEVPVLKLFYFPTYDDLKKVDLVLGGLIWHVIRWLNRFFIDASAITVGRNIYLYFSLSSMSTPEDVRNCLPLIFHELIHVKQFNKYGLFGFALRYSFMFLRELFKIWRSGHGIDIRGAYAMVPFEREAYKPENFLYQNPEVLEVIKDGQKI